jgi:FkbM family methyltransferase
MRFRETPLGQTICRLPAGDQLLDLGKMMLKPYYWTKSLKYRWVGRTAWLLANAQDGLTRRAIQGRLTDRELGSERLRLNLRCANGPLLVRPRTTDIEVIREVFRFGEYHALRGWIFTSILDCGANCGIFAAYAQSQAGSALRAYVGVEPDPDSFAVLRDVIRLRGMREVSSLIQAAVSDKDGTAAFDSSGESWSHRLAAAGGLVVETLTVGSLLDRAGLDEVDLLKLDIEGGEKEVLEAISSWAHRVKFVVVELHTIDFPMDYEWFAATVRSAGFTPMPKGSLFFGLPCAVRDDVLKSTNGYFRELT